MLVVLRLGHRLKRDERLSTHVGLASRALGADEIIYSGEKDDKIVNSINKVSKKWGGKFKASYKSNWRDVIKLYKKRKFTVVQLAMYGLPLKRRIAKIRNSKKILVVVGSEKVPGEVYSMANYNISITSQPHSEVAALAIFLHELKRGKELDKTFPGAKVKIIPEESGKNVVRK